MQKNSMHPLIDQEKQKLARRYKRDRRLINILSYAVGALFLFILLYFQLSEKLVHLLRALFPVRFFYLLGYFAVIYTVYSLLTLPLAYLSDYKIEHKYHFSTQNFKAWCSDWLKSFLITFILGAVIFETIYFIIHTSPRFWWFWLSLVMILFTVILANIFPVVILPLFYKTSPLDDEELEGKIKELCKKAGIHIKEISSIDLSSKSTKANAAVVGLGNTKRILLGDTLMKNFTNREILCALAHEITHYREHHIWWLIFWQSLITMGTFYVFFIISPYFYMLCGFKTVSDPAGFPLFVIIFSMISLIIKPLGSSISRYYERRADKGALLLTEDPESFINLMAKFCNQQLVIAYPNPIIEWYSYTHPSPGRRIDFTEKWQKSLNFCCR
ncbi:MAG TPA: M48 family peptidase [candidate division WOR-3 bacterium]|uniref:M48 family peptidase n=1 Tax=candidate division WOR-3 bacterium TaxID=2052148 RepID=A0A9C9EP81_UNCW3|nr:M48 family peptidase [candidate division WOR-3 bacterium]